MKPHEPPNLDSPSPILVVGFGNSLRRDDGLGPRAAEVLSQWGRPGVLALAVHQLLPELAERLAAARLVLFVDARPVDQGDTITIQDLHTTTHTWTLGHISNPTQLLALTRELYGRSPSALLLSIPAFDLSLGEGLTAPAEAGLREALIQLDHLLLEDSTFVEHNHQVASPTENNSTHHTPK